MLLRALSQVGLVNTHYVYLPIPVVIASPRKARMLRQQASGGHAHALPPLCAFALGLSLCLLPGPCGCALCPVPPALPGVKWE